MKTEEAAKDPKRNPKKRRANYTQNGARANAANQHHNHAQKPPELIQGNHAQTPTASNTTQEKPQRTPEAVTDEERQPNQGKRPQRAIYEARTGKASEPGKGSETTAGNGARTASGTRKAQATHQKPHRATKRRKPAQIPANDIKRHTARNYKVTDKRRTKTAEEPRNVKYI